VHLVYLQNMPQLHAAWGWTMTVPSGLGFSCSEGTEIGGGASASFDCTVEPDANMKCSVETISVMCSKAGVTDTFNPPDGVCLNVGHSPGTDSNDNDSTLVWSEVPSCTESNSLSSGASRGAALTVALLFGFMLSH